MVETYEGDGALHQDVPGIAVFIIRRKKLGWLFFVIDLIFAGIFGWLLPLLAHWR
jgi:hypothetical protein